MKSLNVNEKLSLIKDELVNLKTIVIENIQQKTKKIISLKGLLKDVKVTEEDIKSSKKSLFKTPN